MDIKHFYETFGSNGISVCIDSRKLNPNDIFIAFKGTNFNGNEYANAAIELGAKAAIVEEKQYEQTSKNIFYVDNTLKFIQTLATYHREKIGIKIISLTGSNGKTTTKELIANTLSQQFKVAYTQGNLNNHLGVPLTLLSITPQHDIGVVEMGANHPKEIEQLCKIAKPNYGYITNYGKAHLEGFGNEEGVIKAKSELYEYLRKNNGTAFVNQDDEKQVENTKGIKTINFGFEKEASYPFKRILKAGKAGVIYKDTPIQSTLVGNYNQSNIAAAVTIGLHFGIEIQNIKTAIENYKSKINRSQTLQINGRTIIMDAYNANPSSMDVAVRHFSYYSGSKAVILGDMFELGTYSDKEHCKILSLVKELGFDEIFLLGENFHHCAHKDNTVKTFKTREEFQQYITNNPLKSQNILVKGSRGMQLEKINLQ